MKCHHPDVFCAALLNAQPMGFYAPAQIVRDARAHGVEALPVCINDSRWDCTLEPSGGRYLAVRLGFTQARGLANVQPAPRSSARAVKPRSSVEEVWRRPACRAWRSSDWRGRRAFRALGTTADRAYGRCAGSARRRCRCSQQPTRARASSVPKASSRR
jgi:error-prone DNA polymerase